MEIIFKYTDVADFFDRYGLKLCGSDGEELLPQVEEFNFNDYGYMRRLCFYNTRTERYSYVSLIVENFGLTVTRLSSGENSKNKLYNLDEEWREFLLYRYKEVYGARLIKDARQNKANYIKGYERLHIRNSKTSEVELKTLTCRLANESRKEILAARYLKYNKLESEQ